MAEKRKNAPIFHIFLQKICFCLVFAAKCSIPPLSTIQIPNDELGKKAVELLEELYKTGERKKNVYIAGTPVFRESCCPQKEWDMYSIKKLLTDKEYINQVFFSLKKVLAML